MKAIAMVLCLAFFVSAVSQNVGIGTTVVNMAKLNVVGTASANSNTVALFGTNAGISLQQAWPSIGFNQYRAIPTGNGYAITTGYGMHMAFNYTNGDFAIFRNGSASANEALPLQQIFFSFINSNNSLKLNNEIAGGRVDVSNKVFAAQMGNMNLVPLGIINVTFNYIGGGNPVFQVAANNGAGELYTTHLGSRTNNICYLKLSLNATVINGYSKLVVLPGLNFTQVNSGNLFSLETTVLDESPKKVQVKVAMASEASTFYVNGNLLVYGVL